MTVTRLGGHAQLSSTQHRRTVKAADSEPDLGCPAAATEYSLVARFEFVRRAVFIVKIEQCRIVLRSPRKNDLVSLRGLISLGTLVLSLDCALIFVIVDTYSLIICLDCSIIASLDRVRI